MINLYAALRSGKGRVRSNNEDAFYFNGLFAELRDMDQEAFMLDAFQDQEVMFAVCDGMGGYDNGEVASWTAVSRLPLLQRALADTDFTQAVTDWVDGTNEIICQSVRNGGCTLALLFYRSGIINIAHIGDSRVYRYRSGKLSRVTKDHSKAQVLLDAGILSEREVETYPNRHVITGALGMNEESMGKCVPSIQTALPAEKGDRYLMCSDGVTDMLSDRQLEELMSQHAKARECVSAIYQAAMEAGGKDNTTAILIEIVCDTEGEIDLDADDSYETTLEP